MKTLKFLTIAMAAALLPLTACNDKEETPEAVLEEISVDGGAMSFYAEGGRQRVTLTSEEDWSATCPDWISLSPTSGEAGKAEVVISVDSNYEGQNPGPYRYGIVTFAGSETGSTASVTVSQEGIETVSALNLAAVNDGVEVYLPNLVVTSLFNGGFVALYTEESVGENNDGDDAEPSSKSVRPYAEGQAVNVMVFTEEELELGDGISLTAIKSTMSGVPVLNLYTYSLLSTGNEVGETEATDISDVIDSYDFAQWEYVKVRVIISSDNSISLVKGDKSLDTSSTTDDVNLELPNHLAYIMGYYVNTASNTIELYITGVEDIGLIEEKVLYEEDWDWIAKFESYLDSATKDAVASKSEPGKNRVDSSSYKNEDGITMLDYLMDTLKYTVYTADTTSTQRYYKNRSGYTVMWACTGTYYFGCTNKRGKVLLVPPKFEVQKENMLSLRLTFDVSRRNNAYDEGLRFETFTEDMTGVNEYIIDISGNTTWTWITYTIDMTDVDWEKSPLLGFGSDYWEHITYQSDNGHFFYIDNIKLTWTGVVE